MSVTICLLVSHPNTPVHVIDRKNGRTVWKGDYGPADRPEAQLRAVIDENGAVFGSITVVGPDGAFIGGVEERIVTDRDQVAFGKHGKTVDVKKGGCGAPAGRGKAVGAA